MAITIHMSWRYKFLNFKHIVIIIKVIWLIVLSVLVNRLRKEKRANPIRYFFSSDINDTAVCFFEGDRIADSGGDAGCGGICGGDYFLDDDDACSDHKCFTGNF